MKKVPAEVDWRFRALDRVLDLGKQLADRAVDAKTASIFVGWLNEADRVVGLFPGMKGFSRAQEGDLERLTMLDRLEWDGHPDFNQHMWAYFLYPLQYIRSQLLVYRKVASFQYDLFISYSSNDRKFVEELHGELASYCINIWWDRTTDFSAGDVRSIIDDGLGKSEFGLVVLSPTYLSKKWTLDELGGLFSLDQPAKKRILPVMYKLSFAELVKASPMVAARVHLDAGKQAVEELAYDIVRELARARAAAPARGARRLHRSDWRIKNLDTKLEFARWLTGRIENNELLPYFHSWVSGVSSCVEAFDGWGDWSRWWTCRLAHISTMRQLEQNNTSQVAEVLKQGIKIVEDVRRELISGNAAPAGEHIRRPQGSMFVSYCHADSVYADRLAHECGWMMFSAWWDKNELAVGDSLVRAISAGMQRSANGLVIMSKSFISRNWTQVELDGINTLLAERGQGGLFVLNLGKKDLSDRFPVLAPSVPVASFQMPLKPHSPQLRQVMLEISMKIAPDR